MKLHGDQVPVLPLYVGALKDGAALAMLRREFLPHQLWGIRKQETFLEHMPQDGLQGAPASHHQITGGYFN